MTQAEEYEELVEACAAAVGFAWEADNAFDVARAVLAVIAEKAKVEWPTKEMERAYWDVKSPIWRDKMSGALAASPLVKGEEDLK